MIKWLWEKKLPYTIDLTTQKKEKKRWSVSISVILLFSIFIHFSSSLTFSNDFICTNRVLFGFLCATDRKLLDYSMQFIIGGRCSLSWESWVVNHCLWLTQMRFRFFLFLCWFFFLPEGTWNSVTIKRWCVNEENWFLSTMFTRVSVVRIDQRYHLTIK